MGFWNIQLKNTLPLIISNERKLRVYNIFYKKYQMYQSIVCKKSKNKKNLNNLKKHSGFKVFSPSNDHTYNIQTSEVKVMII